MLLTCHFKVVFHLQMRGIIVFDMSSTNKKPWEGCDDLNGFSDKKTTAINLSTDVQQKNICASRCQTLVARMPQKSPQNHM